MSQYSNITNPKLALDFVRKEFQMLTRNFDLIDWRTVRNALYWKSANILNEQKRWEFKNELISYYNNKGVPITDLKQMTGSYTIVKREDGYEYIP